MTPKPEASIFVSMDVGQSHNTNCLKIIYLHKATVCCKRVSGHIRAHLAISGGLRTGTPISEHDFSYNFSHHISRTLHVVNKEVAP